MELDYTQHVFHWPEFKSVVDQALDFFASTPVQLLPPAGHFKGAGVYALYYTGDEALYAEIKNAPATCNRPIYVGKAVPQGWRLGRIIDSAKTSTLYSRLAEHARNIAQVENLSLGDFRCRFMILGGVESDLIVPVEAALIRGYTPLWNTVVDGFGNHDPGKGRYDQAPSHWDVLHPGRLWVKRLTGAVPSHEEVVAAVRQALAGLP